MSHYLSNINMYIFPKNPGIPPLAKYSGGISDTSKRMFKTWSVVIKTEKTQRE